MSYPSVASAKRCRPRRWRCPSVSPHYMRSWNSSEASWRVPGWTTVQTGATGITTLGLVGQGAALWRCTGTAGDASVWGPTVVNSWHTGTRLWLERLILHIYWQVAHSIPQSVTTDGVSAILMPPRCQQTLKNCVFQSAMMFRFNYSKSDHVTWPLYLMYLNRIEVVLKAT